MSDEEGKAPDGEGGAEPPADEARKKAEAAKARAAAAAAAKAKKEAEEAAKPPWERDAAPPETRDAADDPLALALAADEPEAVRSARVVAGDLTLEVAPAAIARIARRLRDEGFTLLVDICGVHYPQREAVPFEVVYHVYSLAANRRVRLKVALADGEEPPSVRPVWRGADWLEREAWDMYGIRFAGHPDMTRILLWEGFHGHPLRKDFPVEGIDTGAAIYPEYYEDDAGPVAGTGSGWKPAPPPAAADGEPTPSED